MLNLSHLGHASAVIAMQLASVLLLNDIWYGTIAGIMLYIGREHAQGEERFITKTTNKRATAPSPVSIKSMTPSNWSVDSILDLAAPVAVGLLVAVAATVFL